MKTISRVFLSLLMLGVLAGCGGADQPAEVTSKRTVTPEAPAAPVETGKADPHAGMDMSAMGAMGGMGGGMSGAAVKVEGDAPAGWEPAKTTSMRVLNFTVKDHPEAQCYVTVLPGAAGGKAANLNRWREQMGQTALGEAELAALPTLDVLGKPSALLEVTGSFSGMGAEPTPDALLYGLVCELEGNSVFVKMTGPKSVLEGQKEAFQNFCKSLRMPK